MTLGDNILLYTADVQAENLFERWWFGGPDLDVGFYKEYPRIWIIRGTRDYNSRKIAEELSILFGIEYSGRSLSKENPI